MKGFVSLISVLELNQSFDNKGSTKPQSILTKREDLEGRSKKRVPLYEVFSFPNTKTRRCYQRLYARMGLKKITPVLWHSPITVHLCGDAGRVVLVGAHDRIRQKRSPTVHRDRQSVSSAPKDREVPPLRHVLKPGTPEHRNTGTPRNTSKHSGTP